MSQKFTTFPLKKQNSCIENSTKFDIIKGGRKIALQKQFSIDIPKSNRLNDKTQNLNYNQSVLLSDCKDNNFKSLSIFGIKNQTDRSTTVKFEYVFKIFFSFNRQIIKTFINLTAINESS